MLKKEVRVVSVILLVLAMLTMQCVLVSAQSQDAKLDLSLDNKEINVGDTVTFIAHSYINGIQVLSVPMSLTVKEPDGTVSTIPLIGHTNGDYKGSFKGQTPGRHEVSVRVSIDEQETILEDFFTVRSDTIDFEIDVPSPVFYKYGPLQINGSLSISKDDEPINGEVEIYLASSGSPFYQSLKYDNTHHMARDTFDVELQSQEDLTLTLDTEETYFVNDTVSLNLDVIYDDIPLDDALVNLRMMLPDGSSQDILLQEIAPGKFSHAMKAIIPGNYSIDVTVVRGQIFGSAESTFFVVDKPKQIKLLEYETAVDIKTGTEWIFSRINVSRNSEENHVLFDDLSIAERINYSTINLRAGGRLYPLIMKPQGAIIDQEILSEMKSEDAVIEAKLMGEPRPLIDYEIQTLASRKIIRTGDYDETLRYTVELPRRSILKYLVDQALLEVDYAAREAQNATVSFYGQAQEYVLYYKKMDNRVIDLGKFNYSYIDLDGIQVPYIEHVYDLENNEPNIREAHSHDFVEITLTRIINEVVLLGDELNLKVLVSSLAGSEIEVSLFYPNASLALKQTIDEELAFNLVNTSPLGKYTAQIIAVDDLNSSDIVLYSFYVHSSEALVHISANQSQRTVRNSNILYRHIVTNQNYKNPDTINLDVKTDFTTTVLLDSDGETLLTDTNNDGLRDTGLLGPGESKEIYVKVFVQPDVVIGSVDQATIIATSSAERDEKATVVDRTLIVPFMDDAQEVNADVEVVSLAQKQGEVLVTLYNHDMAGKFLWVNVFQEWQ